MAGRFEGLSDEQWKYFEEIIPPSNPKVGRPLSCARDILNTILYLAITGCRWCDIPQGKGWAKRSTAHERLGKWESNGTLEKIWRNIHELAELQGAIDWTRGSVDGSFSPWKRRWR